MMARRMMSGADLSRAIGLSQPQVAKRVRGDLAWSLDELDMLAKVFRCSVTDLLPRLDSNQQPSDYGTPGQVIDMTARLAARSDLQSPDYRTPAAVVGMHARSAR
jgi:DNA-binding Xre family transcriptional regulator